MQAGPSAYARDDHREARASGWSAGDVVGPFLLAEELGRGALASVWRARRLSPSGPAEAVALKLPIRPEAEATLRCEARCLGRLDHPGIVALREVLAEPFALVLELVEGRSLREELRRRGRFPAHRALDIVRQVAEAAACAHRAGIVHGDLKPENILLVRGEVTKVLDFGLVDAAGSGALSAGVEPALQLSLASETKGISGTPAYMAPEQRRAGRVDARADVYAIGLLLFELVTGRGPEGYEAPSDVCPEVTSAIDAIFQRCYAPYARRYPSAAELQRALSAAAPKRPSGGRRGNARGLAGAGAGAVVGRHGSFTVDPALAVPLGPGVARLRTILTWSIYALLAVTAMLAARGWWIHDAAVR